MSCSELAKEYMCQEAHFKLPYENIPQNKQDGITKKSRKKKKGIHSTFICGPREDTHLNRSQKPPIIQCAVNEVS